MKKFLLIAAVFLALLAAAVAWFVTRPAATVKLVPARRGSIVVALSEDGLVNALDRTILAFKIGGKLSEVLVREGDTVAAGQVLARLDDRELLAALEQQEGVLGRAEADLARLLAGPRPQEIDAARARLALAQAQTMEARARRDKALADLQRIDALFKDKAASQQERDDALLARQVADAQVSASEAHERAAGAELDLLLAGTRKEDIAMAQARVREATGLVEIARAANAEAVLVSPFPAIVVRRYVEPAGIVEPGRPAFDLVNTERVEIDLQIDQPDIGEVRVGQAVDIATDAYPGRTYAGRIEKVIWKAELKEKAGRVKPDEEDKAFRAKVALVEPTSDLKPGMKVAGRILVDTRHDILMVPREATFTKEGKWYVWTVNDGRLVRREVNRGVRDMYDVEITDGLDLGDSVVIERAVTLREGLRVRAE